MIRKYNFVKENKALKSLKDCTNFVYHVKYIKSVNLNIIYAYMAKYHCTLWILIFNITFLESEDTYYFCDIIIIKNDANICKVTFCNKFVSFCYRYNETESHFYILMIFSWSSYLLDGTSCIYLNCIHFQ